MYNRSTFTDGCCAAKALTWCVNDEQTRQLETRLLAVGPQSLSASQQSIIRHIGGTNLLCDAASLAVLHIGASHIVQQLGFACGRPHDYHTVGDMQKLNDKGKEG